MLNHELILNGSRSFPSPVKVNGAGHLGRLLPSGGTDISAGGGLGLGGGGLGGLGGEGLGALECAGLGVLGGAGGGAGVLCWAGLEKGLGNEPGSGFGEAGGAGPGASSWSVSGLGSRFGKTSWWSCSWSELSSWSWSWSSLGGAAVVACPSSLLLSYSDEVSASSGGAVGGAGVWVLEDAVELLVKRPLLSLGSEMVAIKGEQFSPGVCSGLRGKQGGVPVLQGQGRRRVISPMPKIKGCTVKSWSKNVTYS